MTTRVPTPLFMEQDENKIFEYHYGPLENYVERALRKDEQMFQWLQPQKINPVDVKLMQDTFKYRSLV